MAGGGFCETADCQGSPVRQRVGFQVTPNILHRVKFRGVCREIKHRETALIAKEVTGAPGLMRAKAIPHNDKRSSQLPSKMTEKLQNPCGIYVDVGMNAEKKTHTATIRGHTQGSNYRRFFVRLRPLGEHGSFAAHPPCASQQRRHQETAFIYKDEMRLQATGFFLIRGHSSLIQRLISFSSRSMARRRGFCGLNPMPCSSRPM